MCLELNKIFHIQDVFLLTFIEIVADSEVSVRMKTAAFQVFKKIKFGFFLFVTKTTERVQFIL